MKRILLAGAFALALSSIASAQTYPSPHFNDVTIDGTINTLALPTSNFAGVTDSQTLTNKSISGSANTLTNIGNSSLVNPDVTVNGVTCTLGLTCSITAPASGMTVGTTTITGGSSGNIEFNNAGVLGEKSVTGSGSVVLSDSPSLTGTITIGGIAMAFPASGNIVGTSDAQTLTNKSISGAEINSGTINTARLPSPFTNGTASGNTSVFGTTSGTLGNGHCATFDVNGNIIDNGASCATQSSGANPSASAGLTAINGSASTFMRSDAAPALSQAIVPTWTGSHTFSNQTMAVTFTGPTSSAPATLPNWSSFTTLYNPNRYAVNGFPTSAQNGGAVQGTSAGGVAEAFTAGIEIPSTISSINGQAGVAGYALVDGGAGLGVGIFGGATMKGASSGGAWGMNAVAVNAPADQYTTSTGFNFGFLGNELDVNVVKTSAGVAPTGTAAGLFINSDSEVQPTGNYNALLIQSAGTAQWKTGMLTQSGATPIGIQLGALANANSSNSQPIEFVGIDSGGTSHTTAIRSDLNGDIWLESPVGNARLQVLANGAVTIGSLASGAGGYVCANTAGQLYEKSTSCP